MTPAWPTSRGLPALEDVAPHVRTPFGDVVLSARCAGRVLGTAPGPALALPAGGRLLHWSGPSWSLEQILTPLPTFDEEGRSPATTWGVAWRVRALGAPIETGLRIEMADQPVGLEVGTADGQHLAALAVDDGRTELVIGGPDSEGVWGLALRGLCPTRWTSDHPQLASDLSLVDEVPRRLGLPGAASDRRGAAERPGLEWTLPALEDGEVAVLACAVSWTPYDAESVWGWLSVDVGPEYVVRHAMGTAPVR
ncbi:hypothetical protein ASE27_12120 [Oerskovia sp. Root918]|uniref:hypothetical protein n=1 Tax=unclassified Oerskovia TaxID=2619021 RepID=UPI000701175A|nr:MULTISPECIES: hypothetical protein [unclassified Oerskovia]KRC35742.1 hypothetical protein ASE15_11715 [Oerskovia sp. Root22]KRD36331.1 hypothetical protein ASE27_12120 [Oerskovia sp. Root918]